MKVMKYRKNSSAIVKLENKFLIVKKPRLENKWQFPQGGIDEGETPQQACKREFKEECGNTEIKIKYMFSETYKYFWPKKVQEERGFCGQEIHFFVCCFVEKNPKIKVDNKEIVDYKFVKIKEFEKFFESENYLKMVMKIILEKV